MEDIRKDYPYAAGSRDSYPHPAMMPRQPGSAGSPQPAAYPQQPRSRTAILDGAQVLTEQGFKPLSREEREEAARIAEEAEFSFDGYQVVRREFFSHKFDPTMTIKGNSITFNNACISKLERAVYIQVLVNPITEKLVIRPCEEGARDSIRWCVVKQDKRKSRQITCGLFTAKLYEMMGWEALYRYKLQGTRINYKGESLYVFDLTSTEIFLPAVKDPENPKARAKARPPVYPANWRDSFGVPVDEHESSMQVDLMEGFDFADMGAKTDMLAEEGQEPSVLQEQLPMEIIDSKTGEVIKL